MRVPSFAAGLVLGLIILPALQGADTPLDAALDEAEELAEAGKYKQALEKFAWYFEKSRGTSQAGVRLSFALSTWKKLGDKYPPAREKLFSLRDEAEREVLTKDSPLTLTYFAEVASIDEEYSQTGKTLGFFKKLATEAPEKARLCCHAARKCLMLHKEYALYLKFGPEPEAAYQDWAKGWLQTEEEAKTRGKDYRTYMLGMHQRRFLDLAEILVGAGKTDLAEEFQRRAVELTGEKLFQSAVEGAKKRVKQKP